MHGNNMGTHKDRKPVTDTYNANLSSWALREKARLGNISQRNWADKITEKTGIPLTYVIIGKWLKGDYKEEMEKKALLALSRWRGDESPEHTRLWLWGETLYDSQEKDRVMAWLRTAKKEDVAEVVQEGMKVVFEKEQEESVQLPLPAIALQMQEQGINIDTLLEKSMLDEDEQQQAVLYLMGKIPSVDEGIIDSLRFTLNGLIKRCKQEKNNINRRSSPNTSVGSPQAAL